MPNLLAFDPAQYLGFIVIFARISGVMLSAPVLSDSNVPLQVRAGFTFILSLIFIPVVADPHVPANPQLLDILLLLTAEVGVGLLMGFTARLLFAGVVMAGEIIGYQMGLGIANVYDPTTGGQVPLIGQFKGTFTLLLFVVMDGHHLFIRALASSYRLIEPGGLELTQGLMDHFVGLAGHIFVVGLQIGAPLIVAMMAANFSIGLVARSVPQVNIFIVGFPFTIALGLLLLALSFPFFIEAVAAIHNTLEELLLTGLRNG